MAMWRLERRILLELVPPVGGGGGGSSSGRASNLTISCLPLSRPSRSFIN